VYILEKVCHISLYNYAYAMYSILTEHYDQGLLKKPSHMFLFFLVLEISLKQSKSTKHLTSFLRHCIKGWVDEWAEIDIDELMALDNAVQPVCFLLTKVS
jgi:hypothetical protein